MRIQFVSLLSFLVAVSLSFSRRMVKIVKQKQNDLIIIDPFVDLMRKFNSTGCREKKRETRLVHLLEIVDDQTEIVDTQSEHGDLSMNKSMIFMRAN